MSELNKPLKKKRRPRYRIRSEKPTHQAGFNRQIWRVVDGAVRDAFVNHPDYLTNKGTRAACARRSIAKRVTGALLSYLEQSKQGRSEETSASVNGGMV